MTSAMQCNYRLSFAASLHVEIKYIYCANLRSPDNRVIEVNLYGKVEGKKERRPFQRCIDNIVDWTGLN